MIKKIIITLSLALLFCSFPVSASTLSSMENNLAAAISDEIISPRADVIKWRYKTLNGKLYKRLYNYSKNVWVGNWIAC